MFGSMWRKKIVIGERVYIAIVVISSTLDWRYAAGPKIQGSGYQTKGDAMRECEIHIANYDRQQLELWNQVCLDCVKKYVKKVVTP